MAEYCSWYGGCCHGPPPFPPPFGPRSCLGGLCFTMGVVGCSPAAAAAALAAFFRARRVRPSGFVGGLVACNDAWSLALVGVARGAEVPCDAVRMVSCVVIHVVAYAVAHTRAHTHATRTDMGVSETSVLSQGCDAPLAMRLSPCGAMGRFYPEGERPHALVSRVPSSVSKEREMASCIEVSIVSALVGVSTEPKRTREARKVL